MYVKKEIIIEGETTVLKFDEVPKDILEKAPRLPEPGECVLVDEIKEIKFSEGGGSVIVRMYLCAEESEKKRKRSKKSRRKRRSRK